ncbi:MAG: hypothetical protein GYB65_19735 [Chloroflexi bacterium]|nr:hypothetical protein [Chloroflexota bacterium]
MLKLLQKLDRKLETVVHEIDRAAEPVARVHRPAGQIAPQTQRPRTQRAS